MISDFGFEIPDLPADSPVFKSGIVNPKSEINNQFSQYVNLTTSALFLLLQLPGI
jgi:hypothetical protein